MLKVLNAGEKRFGLGSVLIRGQLIPVSTNKEACLGKEGFNEKGLSSIRFNLNAGRPRAYLYD